MKKFTKGSALKAVTFFLISSLVLYLAAMGYWIHESDVEDLIFASISKEYGSDRFGAPGNLARKYLQVTKLSNGAQSKYVGVSFLNMVLSVAELESDVKHYNEVLDFARFLLKNGQDVNDSRATGVPALHYYVRENNIKLTEFLLKEGANPLLLISRKGKFQGMTAIEVAEYQEESKGGYSEMISLLQRNLKQKYINRGQSTIN